MKVPPALQDMIDAFERLPGVGPKTASRLAYYLLHAPRTEAEKLAEASGNLHDKVKLCSVCRNVAGSDPCEICSDDQREKSVICVVEEALDILAIEKSGVFKGLYHCLGGVISPLNNIGPDELFIRDLLPRLKDGSVKELVLATNPSMEGEATAMYIQRLISPLGLKITRIARGLPVGGEVEYADDVTLRRAFEGRREY